MLRFLALPALLLTLLAAGCGKDEEGGDGGGATTTETTAVTTSTQEKDAVGCVVAAQPEPRGAGDETKPKLELDPSEDHEVTLKTNCGEIVIALDVDRAPKTAASFASLAASGFYDDLTFHRVLADFVIQGGDPLGNGTGGPGYNVVEKPPSDLTYTRGVVAMAKSQVDPSGASGSQFFIVTAEDAGLPPQYALVGKVKSGMGTVNRIAAQPVDGPQGVPLSPVVIETATVEPPLEN